MSIRGLILRALIALTMLFGMAGSSQAVPPNWVRMNGNVGYVTLEVEQQTAIGIARDPFWQRLMSKVSWGKVATRAGGACVVAGAAAVSQDSFAQQTTWWLKGLRIVSSCAVGVVGGALLDFTQAALLAAAAPELVAFGTATVISLAVGTGLEILVEKLWAAHTYGNGTAVVHENGDVTPPKRNLRVQDDEYASVSRTTTHLSNLRHPQSRWDNGTHINPMTATHVGWDPVGGTRHKRYVPPPHY